MAVIQAKGLTKKYGTVIAVDSIDFDVQREECFGFLGSNGAGKSTTMRMAATTSPVTYGDLHVLGLDVKRNGRAIRARLGVVPQDDNLDEDLNVLQNLLTYGRYFGLGRTETRSRAIEALEFMELTDRANFAIDTLSGGLKRRLLIARALMNHPSVLILDEPTTGLDPHARHLVWQRLRSLKSQGTTMVLSTHYMDEAAMLCDRLAIMDQGHILTLGTPAEIIARHSSPMIVELRVALWEKTTAINALMGKVGDVADAGDALLLFDLNDDPLDLKLDPEHTVVIRRRPNLEDVFIRLTGRGLNNE